MDLTDEQRDRLGVRIRQARKAREWSQADVAGKALVSKNTVTAIELGRTVRPGNLRAVLDALGLPLVTVNDEQADIDYACAVVERALRDKDEDQRRELVRQLLLVAAEEERRGD